jgi:hypothetical protein
VPQSSLNPRGGQREKCGPSQFTRPAEGKPCSRRWETYPTTLTLTYSMSPGVFYTMILPLILIVVILVVGIWLGFMLGASRVMREAAKSMHDPAQRAENRLIGGKLAIGIGGASLVIALAVTLHTWQFTRVASHASGTVIALVPQKDSEGSITYAPTFRFRDANGTEHTATSHMSSSPPNFHVGESITVLYRPDDPKAARIDSFSQVWGLPAVFGLSAIMTLSLGLGLLHWPKIRARLVGRPHSTN